MKRCNLHKYGLIYSKNGIWAVLRTVNFISKVLEVNLHTFCKLDPFIAQ
jgi:hypothetical protein